MILTFLFIAVLTDCILLKCLTPQDKRETGTERTAPAIREELRCFPIPVSAGGEEPPWSYVDSWMAERTFGGERRHEGCDIMMRKNIRGVYPVVSMTDGVIEKIGWLKLGGWRIGIRAESGCYYYYAHMESYSEGLREGDRIAAGEFLGFAGDSGYGSEGTVGQFAVHLHVGIYEPDREGKDTAVNPCPYLRYLEGYRLTADYSVPGEENENE